LDVICYNSISAPPLFGSLSESLTVGAVELSGSWRWSFNGLYEYYDLRNGAPHYIRKLNQSKYDDPDAQLHLYLAGRTWYIDQDDTSHFISGYTPKLNIYAVVGLWSCCSDYYITYNTTWRSWNTFDAAWQDDPRLEAYSTFFTPTNQSANCGLNDGFTCESSGCSVCGDASSSYQTCKSSCGSSSSGIPKNAQYAIAAVVVIVALSCLIWMCKRCRNRNMSAASYHKPAVAIHSGSELASYSPTPVGSHQGGGGGGGYGMDPVVAMGPDGQPVHVYPAPQDGSPMPAGMVAVVLVPVQGGGGATPM